MTRPTISALVVPIARLLKEFDGKPEMALAAYNAGDFRVRAWV